MISTPGVIAMNFVGHWKIIVKIFGERTTSVHVHEFS